MSSILKSISWLSVDHQSRSTKRSVKVWKTVKIRKYQHDKIDIAGITMGSISVGCPTFTYCTSHCWEKKSKVGHMPSAHTYARIINWAGADYMKWNCHYISLIKVPPHQKYAHTCDSIVCWNFDIIGVHISAIEVHCFVSMTGPLY